MPGRIAPVNPWRRAWGSSVARQLMLLQAAVLFVLVVLGLVLAVVDARDRVRAEATAQVLAVARTVADVPAVRAGLARPDPATVIQPLAEEIRRDSEVDFVVVMGLDRTRYSHPDPAQLGRPFVGDLGGAPQGQPFTQVYAGTLGPSVRAVVPVREGDHVVALVAVGLTVDRLDAEFWRRAGAIAAAGVLGLVLALGAAVLIAGRVRRQTYGLDERGLARMYEYHHAVLHAVREGLLLVDADQRVELVNAEARRLLRLSDDVVGRPVADLGLPAALVRAARGEERGDDDVILVGGNALVVNAAPALWQGRRVGAVVTLRDRTELQAVSGELDAARRLGEVLRSQQHESANRLHTVIQLVEMGMLEEALDFANEELQVAQLVNDQMVAATGSPELTALLLGKSTEAAVHGIALEVTGDVADDRCPIGRRDLVTVVGNLVDNAIDAVAPRGIGWIGVHIDWDAERLVVTVDDDGPGVPEGARGSVLQRGWSTKSGTDGTRGIGLALVRQIAQRSGGGVTIATSPRGGARFVVELREVA